MPRPRRVFCFWEPRGEMPAYLGLCMKTWERNLPGYEIVVLDHSNLDRYLPPDTYDAGTLRRLPLAAQKDAIMVAVLEKHGGVFMDVDNIATDDLGPIVSKLDAAEVVTFKLHLAFLAARPGARLLAQWVAEIRERLARLGEESPSAIPWDYAGNAPLARVMTDMVAATRPGRAWAALLRPRRSWPEWARTTWQRAEAAIWTRARRRVFRWLHPRDLLMLSRRRYGFIEETGLWGDPADRYRRYWFEVGAGAAAPNPRQRIIALHNSWTPDWYKELTEREVLEHDCRLSRTLRRVLSGDAPAP